MIKMRRSLTQKRNRAALLLLCINDHYEMLREAQGGEWSISERAVCGKGAKVKIMRETPILLW